MGVNGATSTRGSKVTIERSVLIGGAPAISVVYASGFDVSNSVFRDQDPTAGWFTVNSQAAPTSIVRFSTLYNSVLKCGTTGNGPITSPNNIYVNGRPGAPADTATGTQCVHSYDIIKPQATAIPGLANQLNVDPKFLNALAGDFYLMQGSPAIDAADPSATQATDFEGVTRPQGAGRDIGAFEYH